MSEEKKPIYIANGNKRSGQYGDFRSLSINLSKISREASEHIFEYNGDKFIKVLINDKEQADKYGKDVSMTVDTWKPTPQGETKEFQKVEVIEEVDGDLPF